MDDNGIYGIQDVKFYILYNIMNKTLTLIGKVLLSILIGLLSFLTFLFLIIWGILYKDSHKKGYVGKKGSTFKETLTIFYSGLIIISEGIYYLLFNKDSNYSL